MNIMHRQIKDLFTSPVETMQEGLWMDGTYKDGEYKIWWGDGKLFLHSYWKNGEKDGPYKKWDEKGDLVVDIIYKDGK